MPRRPLLLCLLALSTSARAQSTDEWGAFPSTPAPARAGKEEPAAQPTAEGSTPDASDEATVVSMRERFLPGTEPHSPSTRGRAFDDLKNHRHTASANGTIGLLRVSTADIGQRGVMRFFALAEYFRLRDFPFEGATNTRTAGTFGLSVVPIEFLELYWTYAASANDNTHSAPRLIQSLGDLTLGAKVSFDVGHGFTAAGDLRTQAYSAVGHQDVDGFVFGFAPSAVLTFDARRHVRALPLRVHLNLGGVFDGTDALTDTSELNPAEVYALGINRYHRLTFGAGAELPLPYATPFVEYRLALPLGVEREGVPGPNGERYPVLEAMPASIGLGAKITALKDVTFTAGAELGLTRAATIGLPATPRFNVFLGASFNVDPFARGETRVVETLREVRADPAAPAAPTRAKITGVVLDAKTKQPLPGVMVALLGNPVPPVATDAAAGRFLTHEVPPGTVRLVARKPGYREAAVDVVLEAGKTAAVELMLEAMAARARFAFTITSGKQPIVATAVVKGPAEHTLSTSATASAPAQLEVEPGRYVVNVSAPGFLAQTREVQVSDGAEMALAFDLEKEPAKKLVVVKAKKIQILQQVNFDSGKATILPESYSLLNQVVDAIVRNDVKKIRVEGHTDNRGRKLVNLRLSQERARAVAEYLEKAGIDPRRLEAKGYGDSRPIAPNLTRRGRELNRRVDFMIVDP